jgi:hypothetical protein
LFEEGDVMLEDIMRRIKEREKTPERPPILPEAAVARLRELAANHAEQMRGSRFDVGDLVTPIAGCGLYGAGQPYLVIETHPAAAPCFVQGDIGTSNYGMRLDMRVLRLQSDKIGAFWVESFGFERWSLAADASAKGPA